MPTNLRTLSIKLDVNTLAKINYLVRTYGFRSRSEFVREAIKFKLSRLGVGS